MTFQERIDNANRNLMDQFYGFESCLECWEDYSVSEREMIGMWVWDMVSLIQQMVLNLGLENRVWVVRSQILEWEDFDEVLKYFNDDED